MKLKRNTVLLRGAIGSYALALEHSTGFQIKYRKPAMTCYRSMPPLVRIKYKQGMAAKADPRFFEVVLHPAQD